MKIQHAFYCLTLAVAFQVGQSAQAENDFILLQVRGQTVLSEAAVGEKKLEKGLMYRTSLNENQGMLFVFPTAGIHPFWMKNTLIPLSIAFLDSQGKILNIEEMAPMTLTYHNPTTPAKLALEMNREWFTAHGVKPGDRITCADGNGLKCVPH